MQVGSSRRSVPAAATFLTNAASIFGAASAHKSARQLGHSVTIAERNYVGLVHVDAEARTLEQAMEIEDLVEQIISGIGNPVSGHRGVGPRRRGKSGVEG